MLAGCGGGVKKGGSDGQELPAIEGLWSNVNVKAGGEWLISNSRPMLPVEKPAGDAS
jgi:hypothetical protein